jgi:branched-chain amino acid transport system permease protein
VTHNEQALVEEGFERRLRARLRASISEDMIAEHQASPGGPHRDALSRVLRYFRSAPIAGKYAIYAERHFARYRIVSFSGRRGVPPSPIDNRIFTDPEAAAHAIFLLRVAALTDG